MQCLLLASAVVGLALAGEAAVRYVAPDGSGDGSSWTSAASLATAFEGAGADDEIWLKAGDYPVSEGLVLSAARLRGGFSGNEASADARAGSGISRLVAASESFDTLLAVERASGAVLIDAIAVSNCVLRAFAFSGGADLTLASCRFEGNGRRRVGAGRGVSLAGDGSNTVTLEDCAFVGNCDQRPENDDAGDMRGLALFAENLREVVLTRTLFRENGISGDSNMRKGPTCKSPEQSVVMFADAPVTASQVTFLGNRVGGSGPNGGRLVYLKGRCGGSVFTDAVWAANDLLMSVGSIYARTSATSATQYPLSAYRSSASNAGSVVVDLGDDSGTVRFERCTFAYNLTGCGWTAGLNVISGRAAVTGSVFWGNVINRTWGIYADLFVGHMGHASVDRSLFGGCGGRYFPANDPLVAVGEGMTYGDPGFGTGKAEFLAGYVSFDPAYSELDEASFPFATATRRTFSDVSGRKGGEVQLYRTRTASLDGLDVTPTKAGEPAAPAPSGEPLRPLDIAPAAAPVANLPNQMGWRSHYTFDSASWRGASKVNSSRAAEWFRHRDVAAWGRTYDATLGKGVELTPDWFAIVKPSDGERENRPLVVFLHDRGDDVGGGFQVPPQMTVKSSVYFTPTNAYALVLDCRENSFNDYWWGAMPPATTETGMKNGGLYGDNNSYAGFVSGAALVGELSRGPLWRDFGNHATSALDWCHRGEPPTMKRVLDTVEWAIRKYGIDRNRVYIAGEGMGGQGALAIGLRHGEVFAAVRATKLGELVYPASQMGFVDGDGADVDAADFTAPACDPPVCVDWPGEDAVIRGMDRFAYSHAGRAEDWMEVRKDAAYPVFTNLDGNRGGRLTDWIRYALVEDSASRLAVRVWIATPEEHPSEEVRPVSIVTDITMRRLQAFAGPATVSRFEVTAEPRTVEFAAGQDACDHDWTAAEVTRSATCTQPELVRETCSKCPATRIRAGGFAAHAEVEDASVAPTCTADGISHGSHCSACGYVFEKQVVLPALGHNFDWDGFAWSPRFTCETDGVKVYTCTNAPNGVVCGLVSNEVVAAHHDYVDGYCTGCGIESRGHRLVTLYHSSDRRHVFVDAHRGAFDAEKGIPENSIASIENAIRLGVDIVELDPKATQDGEIVMMHDNDVEKLVYRPNDGSEFGNIHGDVHGLRWQGYLEHAVLRKSRDANEPSGERIARWEEVLDAARDRILVHVDANYWQLNQSRTNFDRMWKAVTDRHMEDQCYFDIGILPGGGKAKDAPKGMRFLGWHNSSDPDVVDTAAIAKVIEDSGDPVTIQLTPMSGTSRQSYPDATSRWFLERDAERRTSSLAMDGNCATDFNDSTAAAEPRLGHAKALDCGYTELMTDAPGAMIAYLESVGRHGTDPETDTRRRVMPLVPTNLTWTGGLQVWGAADTDDYTVLADDGGVDVGVYEIRLRLRDAATTRWTDCTDGDKSVWYRIKPPKAKDNSWVVEPGLTSFSWVVGTTPGVLTAGVPFANAELMTVTLDGAPFDGTLPTAIGSYKLVYLVPADPNYQWNELKKTISFSITSVPYNPQEPVEDVTTPRWDAEAGFLAGLVTNASVVARPPDAGTGGPDLVLHPDADEWILVYTSGVKSLTFRQDIPSARVLAVGGGGGAGCGKKRGSWTFLTGGGGGGGSVLETNDVAFASGSYWVLVGGGGAGSSNPDRGGGDGGTSSVAAVDSDLRISVPGGFGGIAQTGGASGPFVGGGAYAEPDSANVCGGGGAGAGGDGKAGSHNRWSKTRKGLVIGGEGVTSDILGSLQAFGGGGAGGTHSHNALGAFLNLGVAGGGSSYSDSYAANGEIGVTSCFATAGENGLGGGGAGGYATGTSDSSDGRRGGSGIVVIRYALAGDDPGISWEEIDPQTDPSVDPPSGDAIWHADDYDAPEGSTFYARLANDDRASTSPYATGGDYTYKLSDYEYIHVFRNGGTLTLNRAVQAKILTVAGGGAGGLNAGGGGGGGGVTESEVVALTAGDYAVVVGRGGVTVGASNQRGGQGGTSSFGTLVSATGGFGAYGWDGSTKYGGGTAGPGGGDGGVCSGAAHTVSPGKDGSESTILGYSQWFGGGGGGGMDNVDSPVSQGGNAGGGAGATRTAYAAKAGEDGLGGGGGGGGGGTDCTKQNSGNGGKGIVIVRYTIATKPPAPEWDIPGVEGGINGIEGEGGVKTVSFEAIELTAEGLKVNLSAAKIDADGATFGLVCKTDLTSDKTIVINATLAAEKDATEGVLTVKTDLSDYPSLFVVGIGPKVE